MIACTRPPCAGPPAHANAESHERCLTERSRLLQKEAETGLVNPTKSTARSPDPAASKPIALETWTRAAFVAEASNVTEAGCAPLERRLPRFSLAHSFGCCWLSRHLQINTGAFSVEFLLTNTNDRRHSNLDDTPAQKSITIKVNSSHCNTFSPDNDLRAL